MARERYSAKHIVKCFGFLDEPFQRRNRRRMHQERPPPFLYHPTVTRRTVRLYNLRKPSILRV
jgi:hypothetical protein